MAISLTIDEDTKQTVMELRCDRDHPEPVKAEFRGAWFPEANTKALSSGWKRTGIEDLCPACSGKPVNKLSESDKELSAQTSMDLG